MPYRPRVIPTAEDPLAAAITGLREGWRAAAEARRQRQLDEERRQERQFLQDLQRRQQEAREFEVYGQVLLPEPPTVYEIDPDALRQTLSQAWQQTAQRQTAPQPPAAGAYVPGQGFALPRPPVQPSTVPAPAPQGPPIPPMAVGRVDPRYEEFAPGRWGRRDLLPEERAAARARQLEEERMQRLAEALAGLEHIPEASRRAIAAGVPASVALPPASQAPERGQLIQTDQGWALVNPVTGEARLLGLDVPPRATEAAGPGRITETQAKMRVAYSRAAPALEQIERFLGYDPVTDTFAEGGGRVPEESFLGRVTPGRYFQSAEIQAYDQAAEALASAILRIESGAAITQQELESYKRQFIPRPGDKPEVIRRKLQTLRATLDAIRQAAGIDDGAVPVEVPPAPTATTPPTNPFR